MLLRHATGSLLCMLLAASVTATVAAEGATLYQQKTCASCHGADAKTPILPAYPKLAGQNPDYVFQQLKDIKSGVRKNTMAAAMSGIMQNVNEEEMRVIADWLGSLSTE